REAVVDARLDDLRHVDDHVAGADRGEPREIVAADALRLRLLQLAHDAHVEVDRHAERLRRVPELVVLGPDGGADARHGVEPDAVHAEAEAALHLADRLLDAEGRHAGDADRRRRRVGGELPGLAALAVGHHLGRLVVELARHVLPPEMRRLQDVRVGGDQLVRAGHRGCPPARAIQTNVRSFQGACYKRAMHAPVLYMVKAWVSPDGDERYLRWLEEKHMAEVIREPGFLWTQRCRLEQRDEQGLLVYLIFYGLESHEALERYLASPARERFWRELEPLGDVQRAERFYGTVDLRLEAARSS